MRKVPRRPQEVPQLQQLQRQEACAARQHVSCLPNMINQGTCADSDARCVEVLMVASLPNFMLNRVQVQSHIQVGVCVIYTVLIVPVDEGSMS
jgi:hypothetical protein